MAQELVIKSWCDVCLEAGEHNPGETVRVAAGEVAPFEVEVCPRHAQPLAEAVASLAPLGRAPGKGAPAATAGASKGGARGSYGPSARKGDHEGGGECPACGTTYSSRNALRAHLRKEHDQSLADVGLSPARFKCPECKGKFDTGQGFASHVRTRHPGVVPDFAASKESA